MHLHILFGNTFYLARVIHANSKKTPGPRKPGIGLGFRDGRARLESLGLGDQRHPAWKIPELNEGFLSLEDHL